MKLGLFFVNNPQTQLSLCEKWVETGKCKIFNFLFLNGCPNQQGLTGLRLKVVINVIKPLHHVTIIIVIGA